MELLLIAIKLTVYLSLFCLIVGTVGYYYPLPVFMGIMTAMVYTWYKNQSGS